MYLSKTSIKDIAAHVDIECHPRTIKRIIEQLRLEGDIEKKKPSGRPLVMMKSTFS